MQPPGSGKFLNREALIRNVAAEQESETHFLILLVGSQNLLRNSKFHDPTEIRA